MRKIVWGFLASASLGLCLFSAAGHFLGKLTASDYKLVFLVASLGWFIFAALWAKHRK